MECLAGSQAYSRYLYQGFTKVGGSGLADPWMAIAQAP